MINAYKRDGFVVVPNAVEVLHPHMFGTWNLGQASGDSIESFRIEARSLSRRVDVLGLFLSENIQRVIRRLGITSPVMNTSPVIHAMGFDNTYEGTAAHQDWPALQSSLNAITAWIPLHDIEPDSYPLEVVPGSHLMGLLPAKASEHYSEVDSTGLNFVPVTMKRGDVLLFSVFTVHRTRTPGIGTRIAFSHRYEDSMDSWARQHGQYSAQSRIIAREVAWTPSAEQVRECFR